MRPYRLVTAHALFMASSLALVACGAGTGSPTHGAGANESNSAVPAGSGSQGTATSPSPPRADAEPPPPPCDDSQTGAIQKSFEDEAIPLDVGAVALIKDRSCGTRYFTRGASKDVPQSDLQLVGSATKTYVASLTLLLAEEGKLSLSDPVNKWIPTVPGGDAIKIDHLLHHTSGIYNYTSDLLYMVESTLHKAFTHDELLNIAFAKPLTFAPGTDGKWDYSNTGYVMLGMIIEAVSGKPLADMIRERILTPIGAKATFFGGSDDLAGDVAPSTTFLGSAGATFLDPSATWGCGNMLATLDDLANWTEKRGSGAFHSPATQAVLTNGVKTGGHFTYGAALVIVAEGDKTVLNGNGPAVGHGGDTPGYHTVSYYFPKKKATITMTVQSDKGPTGGFPTGATYAEGLYNALVNPYFGTTSAP